MTGFADLRLAPAAAAAWAAGWLCLGWPVVAVPLSAVLAAAAALSPVLVRGRTALVVTGACLAAGAIAGVCALNAARVRDGPVPALARQRAVVDLTLVATGDPRTGTTTSRYGGPPRRYVMLPARLTTVGVGHRRWRVSSPVLVFAPATRPWQEILPSQRLTGVGRLGTADGAQLAAIVDLRGPPHPVGGPSLLQRVAARVRAGLRAASAGLPQPQRGLLPALVDGDVGHLDPALAADFRAAGMTHLTAVSGANIAIVFTVVLGAARAVRLPRPVVAVVAALTLGGFVVVARPTPSVLRAAAMAAITVLGLVTGRPRAATPALLAGVTVLLLLDPPLARSAGFALSVLATAGLLLVAPRVAARVAGRLPGRLASLLAAAAAAQLLCAPLIAGIWGQVSLVAVPANMLAEPAVPAATVAGALAAASAPVCLPLARALAWLGGWPAAWLAGVAGHAAALPAASVQLPRAPSAVVLLLVAAGAVWLLLRVRRPWHAGGHGD